MRVRAVDRKGVEGGGRVTEREGVCVRRERDRIE